MNGNLFRYGQKLASIPPNFDFDHEPISEVLQITSVNTFLIAKHILLQTYAELFFAY